MSEADLQAQIDQLRADLMLVIRSKEEWSTKFCSKCNERALHHRYSQIPVDSYVKFYSVTIPLCEEHALEWDSNEALK